MIPDSHHAMWLETRRHGSETLSVLYRYCMVSGISDEILISKLRVQCPLSLSLQATIMEAELPHIDLMLFYAERSAEGQGNAPSSLQLAGRRL